MPAVLQPDRLLLATDIPQGMGHQPSAYTNYKLCIWGSQKTIDQLSVKRNSYPMQRSVGKLIQCSSRSDTLQTIQPFPRQIDIVTPEVTVGCSPFNIGLRKSKSWMMSPGRKSKCVSIRCKNNRFEFMNVVLTQIASKMICPFATRRGMIIKVSYLSSLRHSVWWNSHHTCVASTSSSPRFHRTGPSTSLDKSVIGAVEFVEKLYYTPLKGVNLMRFSMIFIILSPATS